MRASPVLLWFRLDLRLDDNPALLAAAANGSPVIPVFIWAPEEEEPWPPGAASRWWLHYSLGSLQKRLAGYGSRLIIRQGPTRQVIEQILSETGADTVYWNRRYEPAVIVRDAAVKHALEQRKTGAETLNAGLLFEPWAIRSQSTQRPFRIFSAFWKTCLAQPEPAAAREAPRSLSAPASWPGSMVLDDLHLEPRIDWAGGLKTAWNPGEDGARTGLRNFLRDRLLLYPDERERPDRIGTSRLSPHLHFGEVSPRRVWHALQRKRTRQNTEAVDSYLRELGWREFAYHLLVHFPKTTNAPLRAEFAGFPWRTDPSLLRTWQRGTTGYPIVDAGMRELWHRGWMHNRVRMIVASFLTKHLRMRWEEGAYWFWDTLVDADLANNTLNWQWSAGCGADAAPYFRIFNPVRQSEKFDPDGKYVRRWAPELSRLPAPWIHAPWTAPPAILDESGVQPGKTYPLPIVDHDQARREALASFDEMRRQAASGRAGSI